MPQFDARELIEFDRDDSNNGVLLKWMTPDKKFFIKSSRLYRGQAQSYESLMEVIAHEMLAHMGIPSVKQTLCMVRYQGRNLLSCVSKNYKLGDAEFLSAKSVLIAKGYTDAKVAGRYDNLLSVFPYLRAELDLIMQVDFLLNNTDRHMRNIEFVLGADGLLTLAPLYDNGTSFLEEFGSDEDLEDLLNMDEIDDGMSWELYKRGEEVTAKSFSTSQQMQLRRVATLDSRVSAVSLESLLVVLEKYESHLTALRYRMMVELLGERYRLLRSRV